MRIPIAAPSPTSRARSRCSGGSLFERIEMKMTLSTPSTISSAVSVSSAVQIFGSLIQSIAWSCPPGQDSREVPPGPVVPARRQDVARPWARIAPPRAEGTINQSSASALRPGAPGWLGGVRDCVKEITCCRISGGGEYSFQAGVVNTEGCEPSRRRASLASPRLRWKRPPDGFPNPIGGMS